MRRSKVARAFRDLLLGKAGVNPTSLLNEAIVSGSPRGGGSGAAIGDTRPALMSSQAGECRTVVDTEIAPCSIFLSGGIVVAAQLAHLMASTVSSAAPSPRT